MGPTIIVNCCWQCPFFYRAEEWGDEYDEGKCGLKDNRIAVNRGIANDCPLIESGITIEISSKANVECKLCSTLNPIGEKCEYCRGWYK